MSRDAELLRDAHHVITGERDTDQRNVTYAIYVAVIAAASYGVPAAQAFFRFLDPRWLAAHLAGYRGGVFAGALLLAAVVLRRWWRIALLGCVVGGVLIALVAAAGLVIAALAGAVVLGPGVAAGGL